MKEYGYRKNGTHQAIIFEVGTTAENNKYHGPDTDGLVVGSSEWGWITDDNARRICAALKYFSETKTEEIEEMANIRFSS